MTRRSVSTFLLVAAVLSGATWAVSTAWSDDAPAGKRMTIEEAKELKSPVPYTKESIARGKVLYTRDCTECHGNDGKSLVDVIADATDLTNPKFWNSGTAEGQVFRSIRDGAGEAMPPFADKVTNEEDLWHMVHFLESLWPESERPKL
jgi:mono/diheme cytochrome c family protein